MKKLIFVISFCLMAMMLNAQVSPFLEKGVSGAGITAGYEVTNGYDGVYGKLSYSMKGNLDITLSAFESFYNENEEDLISDDASDTYLSLELDWWFLRKSISSDIDFNMALKAGFQTDFYKNYNFVSGEYDNNGLTFWTSTYNGYSGGLIGFNLNVNFNFPDNWSVQPTWTTYYGMGIDNFEENGSPVNSLYHGASTWFGVSVFKKMDNGNRIVLTMLDGIGSYSGNHTFDLGISYIFSFQK